MAQNLKIELNGNLIQGRIDGADNFEITYRRADETGKLSQSYSSELTFYDDGYQMLKQNLIDNPNGFSAEVAVNVYDGCCKKLVFSGIIRGDAIDWCEPGCYITANIIESDAVTNCIKSTVIWDNFDGFLQRQQPYVRYCIETRPEFISYLMFFFAANMYGMIKTALGPMNAFLSLIDSVFGNVFNVDLNPLDDILNYILDITIQCGRYHPSPFLREYIKNACKKCGLTFQSSILNNSQSPYFNTVMMAAQIQKGRDINSQNQTLISNNLPVETLETLLRDYCNPVWNAEFRVVGNTLIFERKDYFATTVNWIDSEQLLNSGRIVDNAICYNWIDRERWAYGRFEYNLDSSDYAGNEAKPRWSDLIEWNKNPFNPAQSGVREVMLPLGAARFRKDGIDTNVYDFMQTALFGSINAIFGNRFSRYPRALLIPKHTFFNYKFLVYESNGEIKWNYPDNETAGDPGAAPSERYNYPFWFVEGHTNNLYGVPGNGYGFHWIDNPRVGQSTNFNWKFVFKFECFELDSFSFDKTVRLIKGGQAVNGKIEEMSVDFTNRTISLSGIV